MKKILITGFIVLFLSNQCFASETDKEIGKEEIIADKLKVTLIWMLNEKNIYSIIFSIDNNVAGELRFFQIPDTKDAYISFFYVEEAFRSKGYVKLFANLILSKIFNQGIKKIFLHPNPLYKGRAFVEYTFYSDEEREFFLVKLIELYRFIGFEIADEKTQAEFLREIAKYAKKSNNPALVSTTNLMVLTLEDFQKKTKQIKSKL